MLAFARVYVWISDAMCVCVWNIQRERERERERTFIEILESICPFNMISLIQTPPFCLTLSLSLSLHILPVAQRIRSPIDVASPKASVTAALISQFFSICEWENFTVSWNKRYTRNRVLFPFFAANHGKWSRERRDLNRKYLVLEASNLPTVPQPLPTDHLLEKLFCHFTYQRVRL